METSALAWIGFVVMIVSLFLIPLGLPGVWIMIAILFLGVVNGMVSGWIFFLLVLLAGFAEFLEFVAVGRMTARYGGTSRTFWGAVVGGLAGALILSQCLGGDIKIVSEKGQGAAFCLTLPMSMENVP